MKIALFDMDGTLADYENWMKTFLRRLCSDREKVPEDIHIKHPIHIEERMELIKNYPGWWENMPKHQPGFDILNICRQMGFSIHILTKGPSKTHAAWSEKLIWCRNNLPNDVNVTITEDKSLVYGRILVDDYPRYMDAWLKHRPRGIGIMPVNHGNQNYENPQVVKYDENSPSSYKKVCEVLEKAYKRRDGENISE